MERFTSYLDGMGLVDKATALTNKDTLTFSLPSKFNV